jgi:hypothetical protein
MESLFEFYDYEKRFVLNMKWEGERDRPFPFPFRDGFAYISNSLMIGNSFILRTPSRGLILF